MARIQIITIMVSLLFLLYIARLIVKGKLREEYSIVWCVCTFILVIFSFWRDGLNVMSKLFGVFEAPNLVFTACIFAILVYLLHLSVISSKLHEQNKQMAQEIALLKEKINKL
jgi:tellurite resistance protein TehA-like permease